MKRPIGLTARLALVFLALAIATQWLNYLAASEVHRASLQQREVDRIENVSRGIVPLLTRDTELVRTVAALAPMNDRLVDALRRGGAHGQAELADVMDRIFRESRVDVLEITDGEGKVLYRAHDPRRRGDIATAWGIEEALAGHGSMVSTRSPLGPVVQAIEPVRADGRIIGTLSAGTLIGDDFMHALSEQVGANLALIARSGELVASSAPGRTMPDKTAVSEAFHQKIPIYRADETHRATLVYLPVLVVDEAWVVMAEIDSRSAFELMNVGNRKFALFTLLVVAISMLITVVVLWRSLKPLRALGLRAERIFSMLQGTKPNLGVRDDIVSAVKTLDTLTATLLQRNSELAEERAKVEIEAHRNQASAAAEINQLAYYDPLTNLPNRRLLLTLLDKALSASARHGRRGALLFIDLDNFKVLNDTHGHDKGDRLLQQIARRLTGCVRDEDTVARLGGDEFVIMLSDLSGDEREAAKQAETVGRNILEALGHPFQLGNLEHCCTASIGITLFADSVGTVDDKLRQADLAMYQAKAAGRNNLRLFDPEMQAAVTAHAALESGLREAIQAGQFALFLQGQVGEDGRLTGAEALLRWKHPLRGMVSPAEFVPVAEESGVILQIGAWVLDAACRRLAKWARSPDTSALTLAVNVSARQLHHPGFVEQVRAAIERTGANPRRLKLELTESLLVSNIEDAIGKMMALKKVGVGFSLDDFGTGYSSLSYLKQLPLDQLKIDQGFVRDILVDPNDAAIAKMVIALAESLGLDVIAEGVESEAQRDFLARLGCHAYQGYLYSCPLPEDEFDAFVTRFDPRSSEAMWVAG